MRSAPALVVVVTFAALCGGCAFPDYVFPGAGAGSDADVLETTPDARLDVSDVSDGPPIDAPNDVPEVGSPPTVCPARAALSPCAPIEELLVPDSEVVDGKGDDLCVLSPREFSARAGAHRTPATSEVPARVVLRVGISARGIHLHAQVLDDPHLLVEDDPVTGDAIEIFLRGVVDPLTGALAADGGRHVVLAAPGSGHAPFGALVSAGKYGALPFRFASRIVAGGYEVEMVAEWTDLPGQPAPGQSMGFDFAVDVKDDPAHTSRDLQSFLYFQALTSGPTPCSSVSAAAPSCDDRTWCTLYAYRTP